MIQLNKEMQQHCISINSSQQGHIFLLVYDCAIILKGPVQPPQYVMFNQQFVP